MPDVRFLACARRTHPDYWEQEMCGFLTTVLLFGQMAAAYASHGKAA